MPDPTRSIDGHDLALRAAHDPWSRLCNRVAAFAGDLAEVVAVPIVGTGIAAVEACLSRLVQPGGGLLVIDHGPSSRPLVRVAEALRLPHHVERVAPDASLDLDALEARIRVLGRAISHIVLVHHHRGTGLLEALDSVVELARCHGVSVIVEASASYGVLPVPVGARGVDAVVLSADGCLGGPAGLSFVVARQRALAAARAWPARLLYLDVVAEGLHLERHGAPRFAVPDALREGLEGALDRLEDEGGSAARGARLARSGVRLVRGMEALGFRALIGERARGGWIAAFHPPPGVDLDAVVREPTLVAKVAPGVLQVGGSGLLSLSIAADTDLDEVEDVLAVMGSRILRPPAEVAASLHPG